MREIVFGTNFLVEGVVVMHTQQKAYEGFAKGRFRYVVGSVTGIAVVGWAKDESPLAESDYEEALVRGELKKIVMGAVEGYHRLQPESVDKLVRVSLLEKTYDPQSRLGQLKTGVVCDSAHVLMING